jgi:adenylate cyclase
MRSAAALIVDAIRTWTASSRASSGDSAIAASTCARRRRGSAPSASAAISPLVTRAMDGDTDRSAPRDCPRRTARVTVGAIEIERKFLVPAAPGDLDRHRSTAIEQGYLAIADDGTEVRIRRRDGSATLTVKGAGGRTRVEEELEIDGDRFERLWPLTEGRRIEKTRYEIPTGDGLTIELDVYGVALAGLVVAEVEFASEDAADAFAGPDWLGREVTDDARYKNQRLALEGAPG